MRYEVLSHVSHFRPCARARPRARVRERMGHMGHMGHDEEKQ